MSEKYLGVYNSPEGGSTKHLEVFLQKAKVWANRLRNGHLSSFWAWVAYRHQLWPGLRYGLGTLTNDIEDVEHLLDGVDFILLPLLGVNRHIKTGWRKVHQTFGGVGLLSIATEQLIARVNMVLQHFGTPTSIG